MAKTLKGYSLVGTSQSRSRSNDDYYATPYESTRALLEVERFEGDFIEPSVGAGHIAEVIKEYYPNSNVVGIDIVDRGYKNTIICDFLEYKFDGDYNIIQNPPYKLAQEFLEHSIKQIKEGKKIAMFLKIQFLEGVKRRELFEKYPPKYIYVFSKRQSPLNNGSEFDENGKRWSSTMCFAWFIWEKGFKGEPTVRWL